MLCAGLSVSEMQCKHYKQSMACTASAEFNGDCWNSAVYKILGAVKIVGLSEVSELVACTRSA